MTEDERIENLYSERPLPLTPAVEYEPRVCVALSRYSELLKSEVVLRQIVNIVNSTASYNLADTIKTVLSVVPE